MNANENLDELFFHLDKGISVLHLLKKIIDECAFLGVESDK